MVLEIRHVTTFVESNAYTQSSNKSIDN